MPRLALGAAEVTLAQRLCRDLWGAYARPAQAFAGSRAVAISGRSNPLLWHPERLCAGTRALKLLADSLWDSSSSVRRTATGCVHFAIDAVRYERVDKPDGRRARRPPRQERRARALGHHAAGLFSACDAGGLHGAFGDTLAAVLLGQDFTRPFDHAPRRSNHPFRSTDAASSLRRVINALEICSRTALSAPSPSPASIAVTIA